jgi:hypothetical protein
MRRVSLQKFGGKDVDLMEKETWFKNACDDSQTFILMSLGASPSLKIRQIN